MISNDERQGSILSKKNAKEIIKALIPSNLIVNRLDRKATNSILLTFDDGPNDDTTPLVLGRLEEYKARAVFFVVGRFVQKSPHLLREIAERGHIIGNHTYDHSDLGIKNFFTYRNNILKCQALLKNAANIEPILFRPPKGKISLTSILAPKSLHLRTILWTREGGEWGIRKDSDSETIGTILLKTLVARDIVLLHDNNPMVPRILDIILPTLRSRNIDLFNAVDHLL